jgi:hypothetical protein
MAWRLLAGVGLFAALSYGLVAFADNDALVDTLTHRSAFDSLTEWIENAGLVSMIVAFIYYAGRQTKATEALTHIVERHDTKLDGHETRISRIEGRS